MNTIVDDDDFTYSEEALLNRVFYLSDGEKINIFVEDSNKEFEYETIFKKLFKELEIKNIFAVGGKTGVKNAFETYGEFSDEDKIPNLYVRDGDFDRYLSNCEMISNDHYIYLEAYNIENYFLNKDAVTSFVKGKIKKLDDEVNEKLLYDQWLLKTIESAKDLFLLYCSIQEVELGLRNVGYNEYCTCNEDGTLNEEFYKEKFEEAKKKYPDLERIKNSIDEKYCSINNSYFNLICGKHLLEYLYRYILKITKVSFKKDDFRNYLINQIDISKLDYVKKRVDLILSRT